ncbi:hypothetical protein JCM33374_g1939 [Metschnikowia sp. JCM 33374]|nr:hypothetical protein JCM33374_g1939 [Metschnikowia sp. JCM 33374]
MTSVSSADSRRQSAQSSFSMENPHISLEITNPTLPWIREARFGNTLGIRAKAMDQMVASGPQTGSSDLVHWGRHYGEKSSKFLHNSFEDRDPASHKKEEDGYVGFFHYVNGIDYSGGAQAVEKYITEAIGLSAGDGAYFWSRSVDLSALGTYHEKEMVVTLCAYNIFGRAEFRARYVVAVPRSRKSAVSVDASYTIYSHSSKKMHSYTSDTVGSVPGSFWRELAASTLTRLCLSTDDRARQLCGTVNLPSQVSSATNIEAAANRLVSLLGKGHLAGVRPRYGSASTCGADFVKTSKYRNYLVDALVRVISLDSSSSIAESVIVRISELYAREFDFVICRLLKADNSKNNDSRFLQLVHDNVTARGQSSCQEALLLIEQARFLIARKSYQVATKIAATAVTLLPLDFDAWYTLALAYVMSGEYGRALETINAFPVSFSKQDLAARSDVDGICDSYATTFLDKASRNKTVDLRTFESFFPAPRAETGRSAGSDLASMASIWHDQFHSRPHLRHPICGPFYRTPLFLATNMELSAVDQRIINLAGPGSKKLALAAQSAGDPWSSIADFDSKSTWGRSYDLLTLIVTLVGWDTLVHIKNDTFRTKQVSSSSEFVVNHEKLATTDVKQWLQSLFLIIYEDIRVMVQISNQDQDRSALSWGMIGFIGWACKSNLRDNLSSIHTSISGSSADAGFDYYGTVKMLEIFNEFVLSDVCASTIDPLCNSYDGRHYTNKLIIQKSSSQIYQEFLKQLQNGYFSLDNVLLCLTKLVSWDVRWYNYMPNSLITETLIKLCAKYDSIVVRSRLQILLKSLVKKSKKPSPSFTLRAMFAAPSDDDKSAHEFVEGDTIMEYMEQLVGWLESISEQL